MATMGKIAYRKQHDPAVESDRVALFLSFLDSLEDYERDYILDRLMVTHEFLKRNLQGSPCVSIRQRNTIEIVMALVEFMQKNPGRRPT